MSDATPNEPSETFQETSVDPASIEGIFLTALAKSTPEELTEFLNEACGDNAERRQRIDALLRAYNDAGSFLDTPPTGVPTASDSLDFDFLKPSDDPGLLGTLGPYEIYEVIGRGGMGIVFRARDPKLNRVVAVKVLAPELAVNPNAKRRFVREAQAAAAVSHPHVVTIHAVDEDEKIPYLVMECIVGQSLQQKLDKVGSLRLTEVLRISKQIAEGLSAAHKQGLIHRDIKPANILLENGVERVKITDFGLARAVDDVSVTRTGEVAGSPQFMSPEQAMGQRVDQRSDLFSLGCVMYAMCAGRSPFRATSIAAAIRRVCDDEPRPIEEINAEVPEWMIAIIEKLLEKDPNQRFQSADEVMQVLEDHLAGVQSSIPRKPRVTHTRPAPSSRPTPQISPQYHPRQIFGVLVSVVGAFICLGGILLTALSQSNEIQIASASFSPLLFIIVGAAVAFAGQLLSQKRVTTASWLIILLVLLGPAGFAIWLIKKKDFEEADRKVSEERSPEPTQHYSEQVSEGPPLLDRLSSSLMRLALLGPVMLLIYFGVWGAMPTLIEGQAAQLMIMACGPAFFGAVILGLCGSHLRNTSWGWESYCKGLCAGVLAILLPPVWLVGIPAGIAALWILNQKKVVEIYRRKGECDVVWLRIPSTLLDLGTAAGAFISAILVVFIAVNQDGRWSSVNIIEGGLCFLGMAILMLLFRGQLFQGRFVRDLMICTVAGFLVTGGSLLVGNSGLELSENAFMIVNLALFIGMPALLIWTFLIHPGREVMTNVELPISQEGSISVKKWSWIHRLLFAFLGFCALVVVSLAVPALQKNLNTTGELVIHHYGAQKPVVIQIDGVEIQTATQTSNYTLLNLPSGAHNVQVTTQGESGQKTVKDFHVKIQPRKMSELTLHLPIKTNTGTSQSVTVTDFGGLILEIADPGLSVVLLKAEPKDDYQPYPLKSGEHPVPVGKYYAVVRDNLAGWLLSVEERQHSSDQVFEKIGDLLASESMMGRDPSSPDFDIESGSYSQAQYLAKTIEIEPGEFTTLKVSRDLKSLVSQHEEFAEGKFYRFLWNGKKYSFSAAQAQAMQELLQAYADGRPAVMESDVLETLNKDREKPFTSLLSLFNDGKHLGWLQLVHWTKQNEDASLTLTKLINSSSQNSYGGGNGMGGFAGPPTAPVKPKETGAVILNSYDQGLTINVSQDEFGQFQTLSEQTTALPVGKYYVMVFDKSFGWGSTKTKGSVAPPTYYDEQFEVKKGEFTNLEMKRNWKKLAAVEPILMEGFYPFVWNGNDYILSEEQSKIVQQLFKEFADGKIAVDAKSLVDNKDAIGELKRIFNNGNHPAWERLIRSLDKDRLQLNFDFSNSHPAYSVPKNLHLVELDRGAFDQKPQQKEQGVGQRIDILVLLNQADRNESALPLIQNAAIYKRSTVIFGKDHFYLLLTQEQAAAYQFARDHGRLVVKWGQIQTEFPEPTLNEETLKELKAKVESKE